MEWSIRSFRRKRIQLDLKWAMYVIIFFLLFCLGIVGKQVWECRSLKEAVSQTGSQVELLREEKDKLRHEKEALGRLDRVEKVARDDYNMVKKDEIPIFILENKGSNR